MVTVKQETIKAEGHKYTSKVIAATYTKQGYTEYSCSCGDSYKSSYTNPKGLPKPNVKVSYSSKGKPVLTWTDYSEAKTYYIYRSTKSSSGYTKIGSTSSGTYTDTSAKVGKTYYYKVKAIASNSKYNSPDSSYDKAVCKCAAPSVKITLSSKKPKLTWKSVSGAKKYEVYRATSKSGKYTKVKTTTAKSFKDTKAKKGKTYYYKVKAVASSKSVNSAYSSVKSTKSK